ncbi:MAG: hypothetical protein JNK48_21070 [Bryobacterales bacterium]|nr:hypothetical protein [Bryobacterales bacterium]
MTCRELAAIRRDYVRQQWLAGNLRAEAAEHVAGCEACRASLDTERELTAALGRLAGEQQGVQAPPAVEDALLAAFAARRQAAHRARWRKAVWAIPLAAGLLLFAVLRWKEPEPRLAREASTVPPSIEREVEPGPVAAIAPPVSSRPRTVRRAEYVTEFVPLRYGKPLESGEPIVIVRMRLPGSELRKLGLPVAPETASGTVQADVLLGGDGLAKAIRFVY